MGGSPQRQRVLVWRLREEDVKWPCGGEKPDPSPPDGAASGRLADARGRSGAGEQRATLDNSSWRLPASTHPAVEWKNSNMDVAGIVLANFDRNVTQ